MSRPGTIDILNELAAHEQRNLVTALLESTMFVSRLSIENKAIIERMGSNDRENAERLITAIYALGGVPGLRRIELTTADLHYQDLPHIVPRLIADRENMVSKYTAAADRVAEEAAASEVVTALLQTHRDEVAMLNEKLGDPVSTG